jgi:hypothetical protein
MIIADGATTMNERSRQKLRLHPAFVALLMALVTALLCTPVGTAQQFGSRVVALRPGLTVRITSPLGRSNRHVQCPKSDNSCVLDRVTDVTAPCRVAGAT